MVGGKNQMYGSFVKQTMEVAQVGHHIGTGRYLAYLSTANIGGKIFLLSPWDSTLRKALKKRASDVLRHPGHLFDGVFTQSIGIIQAPDLLPDGRADMCDSCPDITIYDGQFVNSCRMDEYRLFGGFVSVVEKDQEEEKAGQ
jgi:predicted AAA+ superfamily ATPase